MAGSTKKGATTSLRVFGPGVPIPPLETTIVLESGNKSHESSREGEEKKEEEEGRENRVEKQDVKRACRHEPQQGNVPLFTTTTSGRVSRLFTTNTLEKRLNKKWTTTFSELRIKTRELWSRMLDNTSLEDHIDTISPIVLAIQLSTGARNIEVLKLSEFTTTTPFDDEEEEEANTAHDTNHLSQQADSVLVGVKEIRLVPIYPNAELLLQRLLVQIGVDKVRGFIGPECESRTSVPRVVIKPLYF